MGSGHFLVEACRFFGEKLYEACRLCDELALEAEQQAENSQDEEIRKAAFQKARIFRQRVIDLPDADDKLMKYLPSAAPEGEETGFSQAEAIALCRRLVAVHCLYGVDNSSRGNTCYAERATSLVLRGLHSRYAGFDGVWF
ncbi:hypothetical protein [Scytonema sp. NUACC26]|uniref:hypothetical protein n=1 Tax=Scytonema sp. NUACC26 TaxID=3140176 RepID=UPI0034DCB263